MKTQLLLILAICVGSNMYLHHQANASKKPFPLSQSMLSVSDNIEKYRAFLKKV